MLFTKEDQQVLQSFAAKLKKLRIAKGLTVSQLANASGISRQHVRELELKDAYKRPTITTLAKLAAGLDVSLSRLVEGVGYGNRGVVYSRILARKKS